MKVSPARVLDVGVGFGRWGMIVREFCDVWAGRVQPPEWQVHIEGIEGFAENIRDYHLVFYNQIHREDARQALPEQFRSRWDVVIFGDVLEHFHKDEGLYFLRAARAAADYVLVNIPLGSDWPQGEMYQNPFERHLSEWLAADFEAEGLIRAALFEDYLGRPFGSFVLSNEDPKNLALSMFSRNTHLGASQTSNAPPAFVTEAQQQLLAQAERNTRELHRIKNTVTWRTYEAIDRSPAGKPLRKIMQFVAAPIRNRWAEKGGVRPHSAPQPAASKTGPDSIAVKISSQPDFSVAEKTWLAKTRQAEPTAIALFHPDWYGVRSSTLNLFPSHFALPEIVDEAAADHTARLLLETGCQRIVCSGFSESHGRLVALLHQLDPAVKLYVLWYGNFLQSQEDYAWQGFQHIRQLCKQGVIYKWGFAKKGMAEVMAQLGYRSGFVMSMVNTIPTAPSEPLAGGPHLGVWSLGAGWRKPPYAMLAAAALIPGAVVHGSGAGSRVQEFAAAMELNSDLKPQVAPQAQMPAMLARMHLNLYVTLSECAPMLPLESLSVGVPCLFGPNSHLFEDHPFLHKSLVVPYPDSAACIAEYARQALENRAEIIRQYIDYAPGYNTRAKTSLAEFLETPSIL